jgi:hypothetical protein
MRASHGKAMEKLQKSAARLAAHVTEKAAEVRAWWGQALRARDVFGLFALFVALPACWGLRRLPVVVCECGIHWILD